MGSLFSCFCKKKNVSLPKKVGINQLEDDDLHVFDYVKNEFYCPICNDDNIMIEGIPELKIYSESGNFELICLKREEKKVLSLKGYLDIIKKKSKKECGKGGSCEGKKGEKVTDEGSYYCLDCKKYLCEKCFDVHKEITNETEDANIYCCEYICINRGQRNIQKSHSPKPIDKLSSICPLHNQTVNEFCIECQKNICKECYKNHDKHKKIVRDDEKTLKAKIKILENDQRLFNTIQFYKMILDSYNSDKDNKIYKKNLIKVAEYIKKENERNDYFIDLAFYRLGKKKKIKIKENIKTNPNLN